MASEKGLFVDCVEQHQPPGTYRYARNIVDSNLHKVIENEDGFKRLEAFAPYNVIGVITIQKDFVVFSTDNGSNHEIGLVTNTNGVYVYTQVYNNIDLNFSESNPIKGEYRLDLGDNRVITWVDGRNPVRILDIDNVSAINNINDLEIFPNVRNPDLINGVINDFGGALTTGAYIIISQYENVDGSTTAWAVHDKVFYINNDSKSLPFNNNDGAEGGVSSNKSIGFTLTSCDTNFDKICIGVIRSTNGVLTASSLITRNTSSTLTILLTGNESGEDITLDEVVTPKASYSIAKAITQLSGRLYLANLESDELPELQTIACNIRINYAVTSVNVVSNTGAHKDVLPPTFNPGEVYAFYLGVELKRGGWVYYHIPGRAPLSGETTTVNNTTAGLTYKRFQVEDTSNKGGAQTNMGYWENDGELYPNNVMFNASEDLRNKAVRHHRFPTVSVLKTTHFSGDGNFGVSMLPVLSLQVSNVLIPTPVQEQISRWSIFFAKKSTTDSLVQGSDIYQFSLRKDGSTYINSGGNFTQADNFSGGTTPLADAPIDKRALRGHSPDLLLNKSISPSYVRFEYKLSRSSINFPYTGFRGVGTTLTKSNADYNVNVATGAVLDYTLNTTVSDISTAAGIISRLDNFLYVSENGIANNFDNRNSEGVFSALLFHTPAVIVNLKSDVKLVKSRVNRFIPAGNNLFVTASTTVATSLETAYLTYYNILSTVHNSFTEQELVPVNSITNSTSAYKLSSATTGSFSGGDVFLSYVSYLSSTANLSAGAGSTGGDPISDFDPTSGVRVWHGYIGYTKNNINYRHEEPGNIGTLYHGKTDVRTLFTPAIPSGGDPSTERANVLLNSDPQNVIAYNVDYSRLNTLTPGAIYDATTPQITSFPTTIIYSPVQNEESKEYSWRTFNAGDKYVLTKNRGEITNIQGFKNRELIIHTTDSIFRSRTDINAGADQENIFFKSADLFELPPEELQPSQNGYAGTQHPLACVLTKFGYFFPDDKQGKVFLYTGESLDEVSSNGMRTFFRDFMMAGNTATYTTGFDEKLNRILLTKRRSGQAWTISFNPLKRTWTSYHDYVPYLYFTTSDGLLYSIDNNIFYINNPVNVNDLQKGRYYTAFAETIYPAFIDQVSNDGEINKLFVEAEWVSEAYPLLTTTGQVDTNLVYTDTFTHITLYSKDHCSGRITLNRITGYDTLYTTNLRNVDRTWYYNGIRDIAIPNQTGFLQGFYSNFQVDNTKLNTNTEWFDQRKFVDKYVIYRLEYDNINNNRILLVDSKLNYRNAR